MNNYVIQLRKTYLVIINISFIVLYLVRYITLSMGYSYIVINSLTYDFDIKNLPILGIVIFIIAMNLFAFFIPKTKDIYDKDIICDSTGWEIFFVLQNLIEIFLYIKTGYTMGEVVGTRMSFVIGQIISVVSSNMIYFFLLYHKKKENQSIIGITAIFAIPYLIKGSKSALFFIFIYIIVVNFVFGNRSSRKRLILYGTLAVGLMFIYPFIYETSYYFKIHKAGSGSFFYEVPKMTKEYVKENGGLFNTIIHSLTRRINALDVLVFKNKLTDANLFSPSSLNQFLLKGFLTSSVVNSISPGYSGSLGAEFASNVGMAYVGGMETTMFGNIYFSVSPIRVVCFSYIPMFILIAIVFRYAKNGVFLIYLMFRICYCIMTGTIQDLTYTLRSYILIVMLNVIIKKINPKLIRFKFRIKGTL